MSNSNWDFPIRKRLLEGLEPKLPYRLLELVQGSPEWLEARYDYLTASQAPVLFDLSPYQTPLELFEEKVQRCQRSMAGKEVLFARGHSAENAAREYLKEQGLELSPAVVVSNQYPFLLASLDGLADDGTIFEAKYVGAETLKAIREGEVPPHHLCQMQAAMLATGQAKKCLYFATDPSGDSHVLEVLPDVAYQDLIAQKAKAFMEGLAKGEPPEPGEKDFHDVNDPLFAEYASQRAKAEIEASKEEELKKKLTEKYSDFSRVRCSGVRMIKTTRKGNIEYAKIAVLKGIDLEKFRKPPSTFYTIKIDKPKLMRGVA
jgi:putative phage-type endonuclease